MSQVQSNRKVVDEYVDQPTNLPVELSESLEHEFGKIVLFALYDLNQSMLFEDSWIVLTKEHVHFANKANGDWVFNSIAVADIKLVSEESLLSGDVTRFYGDENKENFLRGIQYTHRQKSSVSVLLFVLKEQIIGEKKEVLMGADEAYLNALSRPVKKVQASVTSTNAKVVWRLISCLFPYKGHVLIGLGAALVVALVALIPAWGTGRLIDEVVNQFQEGDLALYEAQSQAVRLVLIITAAYLLKVLFLWVRFHMMSFIGEYVASDLRNRSYSKVQKLGMSYFEKNQTGTVISRVTSDTDRIWDFIAFGVVEVSLSVITLLVLSVVLLMQDLQLGLVMVVPVPFILWAIVKNGEKMQKLYIRAWRKWSSMTAVVADTVPGMKIVKAFHQEDQEEKRFSDSNDGLKDSFLAVHKNWTKFWPVLLLFIHLISIAIYWLALPRLITDSSDPKYLSAGTFVMFVLFMGQFFQPIEVFGQMARMLNRSISSARRVFELIDLEVDKRDESNSMILEDLSGAIRFEGVSFAYDKVHLILKNLSFDVKPGEMLGVVGASGAGKSTMLNLIPRFHELSSGKIYIDETDLDTLDIGWFRKKVGLVPQEPFLFHGTIVENIRYGLPEASLHDVIEAARKASGHDFIAKLPLGYDTIVGERGHNLSGGERQRVAIARAILHDPKILLLDEATSSVDSETEAEIQKALDELVKGRTTLVIAHRLSTLRQADRILVIEDGKIVEEGEPKELLLKENGYYKKMVDSQKRGLEA